MPEKNEVDKADCLCCPACGHGPPAEIEPVADLILAGSLSPFTVRCEVCGTDYDPQNAGAQAI